MLRMNSPSKSNKANKIDQNQQQMKATPQKRKIQIIDTIMDNNESSSDEFENFPSKKQKNNNNIESSTTDVTISNQKLVGNNQDNTQQLHSFAMNSSNSKKQQKQQQLNLDRSVVDSPLQKNNNNIFGNNIMQLTEESDDDTLRIISKKKKSNNIILKNNQMDENSSESEKEKQQVKPKAKTNKKSTQIVDDENDEASEQENENEKEKEKEHENENKNENEKEPTTERNESESNQEPFIDEKKIDVSLLMPLLGPSAEEEEAEKRQKQKQIQKITPQWMEDTNLIDDNANTPIDQASSFLGHIMIENLKSIGCSHLFPVQTTIIPQILQKQLYGSDLCVCAPTGSGKTLAYVIPIVQDLMSRIVPRLRALVIVPTRDLVSQVKNVFEQVAKNTNLRIESMFGNETFHKQQQQLFQNSADSEHVDILISTPGRLIDHLNSTPNFTLQHLRFLVIDEADRLLEQSYQDWLPRVLSACYHNRNTSQNIQTQQLESKSNLKQNSENNEQENSGRFSLNIETLRNSSDLRKNMNEEPLYKMLFSATLTRNPQKLAALSLNRPIFFSSSIEKKYKLPNTLKQFEIVCSIQDKPLMLLHLLKGRNLDSVLCFTSSVESTHRLYLLLSLFSDVRVAEYSGNLSQSQKSKIIEDFKSGSVQMIICSDVMARGLDILEVKNVVHYEIPSYVQAYVHRSGRTARAGASGKSYALVQKKEIGFFKKGILDKVEGGGNCLHVSVKRDQIEPFLSQYETALSKLKELITQEKMTGKSATNTVKNINTTKKQ